MRRFGIFNIAFFAFFAAYLLTQSWLVEAVKNDAESRAGAWGLFVFAAAFVALYAGAAYWLAGKAPRQHRWLAFPAAYAILEWFRGNVFIGYPWALVASAWVGFPPILQAASLVGAYGLGLITLIFITGLLERRFKTAAAIAAVVIAFGLWRLQAPERITPYKARLVNIGEPATEERLYENLAGLEAATRERPLGDIDFVVWPESAVPIDIRYSDSLKARLSAAAAPAPMLITGYRKREMNYRDYTDFNSMAFVPAQGDFQTYDKMRLAPFGEYRPIWLPSNLMYDKTERPWGAGRERPVMYLKTLRASPYICYEASFPGLGVPGHIDLLIAISNDWWFPEAGKLHHFNQLKIRAVEEGVPILRAANSGISAAISPYGRVIVQSAEPGALDVPVPKRLPRTAFGVLGNASVLGAAAIILLFCFKGSIIALWRRRSFWK